MFCYCFIRVIDYMLVLVMTCGKYSMKNMVAGFSLSPRWILYTVYLVLCPFPLGFLI